jgi:hypothetical protein
MTRGIVLYRGPSLIDGGPIVAIATFRSDNQKTGDVPQVWILREDSNPVAATRTGADRSICGDCPLRGAVLDGRNVGRSCYVVIHQAPTSIWLAYRRGIYREVSRARLARIFRGAFLRIGAYGDPAAVPSKVWRAVLADARGWTAYTHQWRAADVQWLAMASCETDADAHAATARGYRVFRIVAPGSPRLPGHALCPASDEQGRRMTCMECRACNGAAAGGSAPNVQIQIHGQRRRNALPLLASTEGGRACAP